MEEDWSAGRPPPEERRWRSARGTREGRREMKRTSTCGTERGRKSAGRICEDVIVGLEPQRASPGEGRPPAGREDRMGPYHVPLWRLFIGLGIVVWMILSRRVSDRGWRES